MYSFPPFSWLFCEKLRLISAYEKKITKAPLPKSSIGHKYWQQSPKIAHFLVKKSQLYQLRYDSSVLSYVEVWRIVDNS